MKRSIVLIFAAFCLLMTSCYKDDPPYEGEYSDVFIYCGLGYNNLSSNLRTNLKDLCKGILPGKSREKAIVAFAHNTSPSGSYSIDNPPVLMRIHRAEGKATIDTLKVYEDVRISASADVIRNMLEDVRELFPSRRYSMLFSSHATGWVPDTKKSAAATACSLGADPQESQWPLTKSVGSTFIGSYRNNHVIELTDFAKAFPMKMDYIIFDACLMGGIEVAWELKDICDKLVFSPAEILASGMKYENLSWQFLSGKEADLESFCREYYEYYSAQTGNQQACTISLVDCRQLDRLGEVFSGILEAHRDGLESIDSNEVQKYFYDSKRWYYDFRDIAVQMGAGTDELRELDEALEQCVLYHAETKYFFSLKLERCCGLSMYIENSSYPELNSFYKTLAWNKFCGLVE